MTNDDSVPGRSAALQQFFDIYSGVTSRTLGQVQAASLLQELDNYLSLEVEKFAAFPSFDFDWPDYENGLEEVIAGLEDLQAAVHSTAAWEERLRLAEGGNQKLLEGLDLLQQAHQQTQEGKP